MRMVAGNQIATLEMQVDGVEVHAEDDLHLELPGNGWLAPGTPLA